MKKRILLLLLLLLLSGCKKKPPEETLPTETSPASEATESAAPEVEYATAQVNGIPAVLETLSRGDSVDVVQSYDEKHVVVKLDTGYGLVEKNLIRMDTAPAFAAWTGYAYQGAALYDNYRLAGEPVRKLAANGEVQVLEDLGWCYLVEQDGSAGYMKQETLARKPLDTKAGTSGKDDNAPVGEDGGVISMGFAGKVTLLSAIIPQEGTISGKAMVLADETQVILGYFDRGDQIPVVKQENKDGKLTVYLNGIYAEVDLAYVQTAEGESFASWIGQTQQIASVYEDYWMLGSPSDRLNAYTAVTVLYELENCYLVEVDGRTGYMKKTEVTPMKADTPEETRPAATEQTLPKQNPEETKPTESKPTEPVPTESKPAEPEPTESAPTEPKPAEAEPMEPKPTAPKLDPEWTPPVL